MCLTVPCEVIAVNGAMARVSRGGETLDVSLVLLDEAIDVGDWLAVQAQRFATSRMSPEDAREILDFYQQLSRDLNDGAVDAGA
jgi:hydrogenase expression/formation protein HypC